MWRERERGLYQKRQEAFMILTGIGISRKKEKNDFLIFEWFL